MRQGLDLASPRNFSGRCSICPPNIRARAGGSFSRWTQWSGIKSPFAGTPVSDVDTPLAANGVTPVLKPAWDYLLLHETSPVAVTRKAAGLRVLLFPPGSVAFLAAVLMIIDRNLCMARVDSISLSSPAREGITTLVNALDSAITVSRFDFSGVLTADGGRGCPCSSGAGGAGCSHFLAR